MTSCLRPEAIIDVVDGVAGGETLAHVESCARCRALVADVRSALAEAERVDVPEPSPLFWTQVNARVRAAIHAEPPPAEPQSWAAWLRVDVLVPLAGLTALVVVLASAIGRVPVVDPAPRYGAAPPAGASAVTPPGAVETSGAGDGAFELVVDLVASMPEFEWDTLGLSVLPELGQAAEALTAEEQQALSALLQAAVEGPPS